MVLWFNSGSTFPFFGNPFFYNCLFSNCGGIPKEKRENNLENRLQGVRIDKKEREKLIQEGDHHHSIKLLPENNN